MKESRSFLVTSTLLVALVVRTLAQSADPLPSWNAGKTKQSIMEFVAAVTRQGSPQFVPPAARIATFDNDGTLWAEMPLYFQVMFATDRAKALAPSILSGRTKSHSSPPWPAT